MNLEPGLVICAHSDDEYLGCSKLFEDGLVKRVLVISASDYQVTPPYINPTEYAAIRRKETLDFCASRGIRDVSFLNYPDHRLSSLDSDSFDALYDYVRKSIGASHAVYCHSMRDPHLDHKFVSGMVHRILSERVKQRLLLGPSYRLQAAYEYHIGSQPKSPVMIPKNKWEDRLSTFRKAYPSQYNRLKKSGFDFSMTLQDWYQPIALKGIRDETQEPK